MESFKHHQKKLRHVNFEQIAELICGGEATQLAEAVPSEATLELPVQQEQPRIAMRLEQLGAEAIPLEHSKRYYIDAQNNQTLQVFHMRYQNMPTVIVKTQWLHVLDRRYLLTLCKATVGAGYQYVYALLLHSNKSQCEDEASRRRLEE